MNSTVVLAGGPAAGQRFELVDELVIGREAADIVLDDPRVSRRHAVIRMTSTGVYVEDLGSTNGTYVNSERVMGEVALNPGEKIRIGDTELHVERPVGATVVADAPPPVAGGTVVGAVPSTVVGAAPAEAQPAPAAPAPAPPAATVPPPAAVQPPPTFEAPNDRAGASGFGGVATRRSLPTVLTIGTIVGTAIALIAYFAAR